MFPNEQFSALPFHFWSVMFFILGTIVGSFLNVCIYRIPRGENIIFPPSHCPHCKYSIPWYLNIPLFTWLFLRGKCANCGAPITIRYFIVELMTGLLFLLAWNCVGGTSYALAALYCLIIAALIVASFIDFEHFIIPDGLTLGGIATGFILSFFFPILHLTYSQKISLQSSFLGILIGGGILYIISRLGKLIFGHYKYPIPPKTKVIFTEENIEISDEKIPYQEIFYRSSDKIIVQASSITVTPHSTTADSSTEHAETENNPPLKWDMAKLELSPSLLKINDQSFDPHAIKTIEVIADKIILPREVMGLGDVKLMAAIGAFLGWQAVIFTLFASSLIGSIVGVVCILLGKNELSSRIPYGPYIAIGTLIWMLGGFYHIRLWADNVLKPLLQ